MAFRGERFDCTSRPWTCQAEDARHARTAQGTSSLTPLRAKPPDPTGALPIRARDHVRGAQPRGPAIPLVVGRRSHAGGSSAPLRSAPRRGASRGWGFEAALRRTARSPVVTRTVSHGSEPIQRGNLRGGLLVAGKAPGALPVAAGSRCHGGHLSRWIASGTPRASRFPAPAGPIRVLAERPSGQRYILFTEPAFQQRVGTPISVKPAVLGGRRVPGSWLCSTGTFRPGTL